MKNIIDAINSIPTTESTRLVAGVEVSTTSDFRPTMYKSVANTALGTTLGAAQRAVQLRQGQEFLTPDQEEYLDVLQQRINLFGGIHAGIRDDLKAMPGSTMWDLPMDAKTLLDFFRPAVTATPEAVNATEKVYGASHDRAALMVEYELLTTRAQFDECYAEVLAAVENVKPIDSATTALDTLDVVFQLRAAHKACTNVIKDAYRYETNTTGKSSYQVQKALTAKVFAREAAELLIAEMAGLVRERMDEVTVAIERNIAIPDLDIEAIIAQAEVEATVALGAKVAQLRAVAA